ncbi:hypothetical protein MYP_1201 [Sporocytophaga myxococcoides]|uniref:Uncharacterized protein n=1 Tax=Sporocytophaga myxococcoides TaxID=153721 RepID=A0A098LCQ9_9BACT|nr:hypothetical protein [Sporocytophaga myxococcoides]GAL83973.1 hypothetical protein MYP_1201 [Sporocytophaga myxococcoides]
MITDNKIDGLPAVTKVLSVITMLIGVVFAMAPGFLFKIIGGILFLFTIAAVTAQEKMSVDFENRKYRHYYKVLGMNFGKWRSLKNLSLITITLNKSLYREVNYALFQSPALKVPMFSFLETNVNINLKLDNSRLEIAKGKYVKMKQLAID